MSAAARCWGAPTRWPTPGPRSTSCAPGWPRTAIPALLDPSAAAEAELARTTLRLAWSDQAQAAETATGACRGSAGVRSRDRGRTDSGWSRLRDRPGRDDRGRRVHCRRRWYLVGRPVDRCSATAVRGGRPDPSAGCGCACRRRGGLGRADPVAAGGLDPVGSGGGRCAERPADHRAGPGQPDRAGRWHRGPAADAGRRGGGRRHRVAGRDRTPARRDGRAAADPRSAGRRRSADAGVSDGVRPGPGGPGSGGRRRSRHRRQRRCVRAGYGQRSRLGSGRRGPGRGAARGRHRRRGT